MGILNVTPDSFSDGACYFEAQKAVDAALRMEDAGADIIDVGGESTRPTATPVDEDEELRRIVPVMDALAKRLTIPLSIDTYKASVADRALAAGAEIVNDISGFTFDPEMAGVVATTGAGAVLMHTRGRPTEMQKDTTYHSLIDEIRESLVHSLTLARTAGIADEALILDPGIGFGKSVRGNLEIIRRLGELLDLGRPLLIGTSRKSFIGEVTGRGVNERLFGTAATVVVALVNGASVFRVHDVGAMRDVVDMTWAILNS
jgi:dihydropteroate synthase